LLAQPLRATQDERARYWPQWRGPLATGAAPHAQPPLTWSEDEHIRWKVAVPGKGHSTPIVWKDHLFLTTAVGSSPEKSPQDATNRRPPPIEADSPQRFDVLAFDRNTGTALWRKTVREAVPPEGTHADGSWASPSPITDGRHVFAFFGSNGLYALTLDGKLVWEKDLGDMHTRNAFGEGASPALHGDTLVLLWDHEGPSFIVALDKNTGEERWRAPRDEPTSWSTPLVVEVDGRAQVITSATNHVRSYDLETGRVVWDTSGMTLNTIPSPVYGDGTVFVASGFRGSALLAIRTAESGGDLDGSDAILWTRDQDTPYVPSLLLYERSLYFFKGNSGVLTVLDTRSGEPVYARQRTDPVQNVYASPVAADGRIYIAGRSGDTLVLRHGKQFEVLGTNTLDDSFDASPALVDDTIYLRGARHLYAIGD
jgi:outer membrane protein assembly factor BamB